MRGERENLDIIGQFIDGSSPHARGTHDVGERLAQGQRIIPACAGNALSPNMLPTNKFTILPKPYRLLGHFRRFKLHQRQPVKIYGKSTIRASCVELESRVVLGRPRDRR